MKVRTAECSLPAVIPPDLDPITEGASKRIHKALFQARKSRHYRDCSCRQFQGRYCNALDQLWQNAVNRELGNLGVNMSTSDSAEYNYDDSDDTVIATSTSPDVETVVSAPQLHVDRPSPVGKRPKRTTSVSDKYTPFTWR